MDTFEHMISSQDQWDRSFKWCMEINFDGVVNGCKIHWDKRNDAWSLLYCYELPPAAPASFQRAAARGEPPPVLSARR